MLCAYISNADIDNLASYNTELAAYGFFKEVDEKGKAHYWYENIGDIECEYAPDYSLGNEVFADSFVSKAQSLVPVDTGFLLSSINAYADSGGIDCVAEANYAEYVEYGTIKMDAQPFFEPALDYAYRQAMPYWEQAKEEAKIQRKMDAVNQEENFFDFGGMENASLVAGLANFLLEILILAFMTLADLFFSDIFGGGRSSSPPIDMGYFIDTVSGGIENDSKSNKKATL